MFAPGTVIKKGYTLSITSWENDGDDYDTKIVSEISDYHRLNEYLLVLGWFSHCADDMGGTHLDHQEMLTRLFDNYKNGKLTLEFISTFIESPFPSISSTEEDFEDWLDSIASEYGDVEDRLHELLGYPVSYDTEYMRVVSKVEVHYFDEDFVVPDLPKPQFVFDGDWRVKSTYEGWSI